MLLFTLCLKKNDTDVAHTITLSSSDFGCLLADMFVREYASERLWHMSTV